MQAKVDIAGTYVFNGHRLTNPDQPFYLRFEIPNRYGYELTGKVVPGLSYTSPTGFFRYVCESMTYVYAYRLDGEQLDIQPGLLMPYTDRQKCRFFWVTPNSPRLPWPAFTYELTARSDDTGRLVMTIQPWPDHNEPLPNPSHPSYPAHPSLPPYPPEPVESSLTQVTQPTVSK